MIKRVDDDNAVVLQIDCSTWCSRSCHTSCASHRTADPRAFSMTTRITQRGAGTGRGRSGQGRPPTSRQTELQP